MLNLINQDSVGVVCTDFIDSAGKQFNQILIPMLLNPKWCSDVHDITYSIYIPHTSNQWGQQR